MKLHVLLADSITASQRNVNVLHQNLFGMVLLVYLALFNNNGTLVLNHVLDVHQGPYLIVFLELASVQILHVLEENFIIVPVESVNVLHLYHIGMELSVFNAKTDKTGALRRACVYHALQINTGVINKKYVFHVPKELLLI